MTKTGIIILCVLSLFACKKDKNSISESILGKWTFSYFESKTNGEIIQYTEPVKMGVEFTDSGKVIINGFCNEGFGNYVVSGEFLTLTNISMTEKGCSPIQMNDVELRFIENLKMTVSFIQDNDSLTIYTGNEYDLIFYK